MRLIAPAAQPSPALSGMARAHIPALDGVRGLAILLVLWHHCYLLPHPGHPLLQAAYQLSHAGWLGVDLFFVLSGFLITGILFDSVDRRDYFSRFYRRRALRIFPLYYGVIALLLLATWVAHIHWHGREWLLLTYTQNIGLRAPFTFDLTDWANLNHFWSLAIEEQYYLVWPFVIYLAYQWNPTSARQRLIGIATLFSAAALAMRFIVAPHINPEYLFTSTPFRADSLLIGSALALILRGPAPQWWRATRARPAWLLLTLSAAALALLGYLNGSFEWWDRPVETVGFTLASLLAAALIALCIPEAGSSFVRNAFSNRILRWFGKYSYGLYVWHALPYSVLRWRVHLFLQRRAVSELLSWSTADVLSMTASVGLAWLSFHLFEQRFLALKDRTAHARQSDRELVTA
ncbi:MAG TPA: acyltransferase [Terriglobales bacterium]